MQRIKTAQIITTMEPGGAQASTINLARALASKDYASHIVCGTQGTLLPEKAENIKVHRLNSLVRQISPVKDILAFFSLVRLLRREKFDIVHTHSSKAGIIGRLAARAAGAEVVVHTVHGFAFHPYQNRAARFFYTLAERMAAGITDKLVCVCQSDIDKGLKNKVGKKEQYTCIRDFFNPLTPDTFRYADEQTVPSLNLPEDKKIVTMCACLKPQKNPFAFVRAAHMVRDAFPQAFFVLAGDGELRTEVETQIKKLNLEDSFLLPGWVSDIDSLLKRTNVFVLTSLHEGLPLALLEAMAKNIPVVASAVDGIKEVIKDGRSGLLVEPDDTQGFAGAIVRILKGETELEPADKKLMEEFSQDKNLTLIDGLYRQLIKNPA